MWVGGGGEGGKNSLSVEGLKPKLTEHVFLLAMMASQIRCIPCTQDPIFATQPSARLCHKMTLFSEKEIPPQTCRGGYLTHPDKISSQTYIYI